MLRNEAAIPSPTISVIKLGPLPIHIYALCIVAGIAVALYLTDRRWRARGGAEHDVSDVAGWAVIFGILGGRLYHVISDPELYFGAGRHPIDALKIWDGGLGIWGAIALGALGAYIGCRRHNLSFITFADAAAPGVVLAQALGRLGNWFNNELYGGPTSLPWRLQIHDMDITSGRPQPCGFGNLGHLVCGYYQPTFLYEMLWNIAIAVVLLWADRRFTLARGQVFALYVMGYTFGRFWIEALRSDHANHIAGMRLNDWVAILVFLGALALFLRQRGKPRSTAVRADEAGLDAEDSAASDGAGAVADGGSGDPKSAHPTAPDLPSVHGGEADDAGRARPATERAVEQPTAGEARSSDR